MINGTWKNLKKRSRVVRSNAMTPRNLGVCQYANMFPLAPSCMPRHCNIEWKDVRQTSSNPIFFDSSFHPFWYSSDHMDSNLDAHNYSIHIVLNDRDVKPENIVLEGGKVGGRVFLVDFGGVQAVASTEAFGLGSTVIGTYGYMAPEAFRGVAQPASDLYALGGTLLYLLSGKHCLKRKLMICEWPLGACKSLKAHLNIS